MSLAGACSGENPYQAAKSNTTTVTTNVVSDSGPVTTDNPYLPVRENVSDCFGAVERPDCGSKAKGGWQMYLTFAVLIAGMSFIGWRVVRGVKARDAAMLAPTDQETAPPES